MKQHTLSQVCFMCGGALGSSANKRKENGIRMCFRCKKNGAPDEYRCHGITASKTRCKHWALIGTKYCKTHEVKE
jgi:hypothetical protein